MVAALDKELNDAPEEHERHHGHCDQRNGSRRLRASRGSFGRLAGKFPITFSLATIRLPAFEFLGGYATHPRKMEEVKTTFVSGLEDGLFSLFFAFRILFDRPNITSTIDAVLSEVEGFEKRSIGNILSGLG